MRLSLPLFLPAALLAAQNYPIQQPKGTWQRPGEIQQPRGPWQKPGAIQVPKGIQAIRTQDETCRRRLIVGADALFQFDNASLMPDAMAMEQAANCVATGMTPSREFSHYEIGGRHAQEDP